LGHNWGRSLPRKPVHKVAWVDHYYTMSYEAWMAKIRRGSCDRRCLRRYDEFFDHNPDMRHLYDETLAGMTMSFGHGEPTFGRVQ